MIVFALGRLGLEICQFGVKCFYYFSDWVNWMEWVLFPCSIIFAAMPDWICPCVLHWQWQVGVLAVFLAWCDFIVFTSKFPFVGIYVIMFTEICKTFLKLVLLTLLLIITFGITFYMIFFVPDIKVIKIILYIVYCKGIYIGNICQCFKDSAAKNCFSKHF